MADQQTELDLRREWLRAREERSIMQDCIRRAHVNIGDLLCSNGDYTEDIATLRGLVERWQMVDAALTEEMETIEHRAKQPVNTEVA